MTMKSYRTLGRSGLVVSPLALGTMTFGTPRWGCDETTARDVFEAYVDAGGNFVDTADIYAGGESERFLGRFIKDMKCRERVVVATKYGFNAEHGNPLAGGNGAKHVRHALEGSLERLQTDYVDMYWMHIWDGVTPAEEVLHTMCQLVREGKILHYGLSDMPAWFAMKIATLASERGLPGPVAMQLEYSLVARSIEREHASVGRDAGMAVVPWSPLAGGFLTGKYEREAVERDTREISFELPDEQSSQDDSSTRLQGSNPFGDSKFTPKNWEVLDVVNAIAQHTPHTPAQVALAWLMAQPHVGAVVVGARTRAQIQSNLASTELTLTPAQLSQLSEVSALTPEFSDSLTTPYIRRMLFGGHDVKSWTEQHTA